MLLSKAVADGEQGSSSVESESIRKDRRENREALVSGCGDSDFATGCGRLRVCRAPSPVDARLADSDRSDMRESCVAGVVLDDAMGVPDRLVKLDEVPSIDLRGVRVRCSPLPSRAPIGMGGSEYELGGAFAGLAVSSELSIASSIGAWSSTASSAADDTTPSRARVARPCLPYVRCDRRRAGGGNDELSKSSRRCSVPLLGIVGNSGSDADGASRR